MLYLDNNATTAICNEAKRVIIDWISKPNNASGTSAYGQTAKKLIDSSIKYIQKHCNASNYKVIFTSGATESNCFILRSTADAWSEKMEAIPHIITSTIEHKSILSCLDDLENKHRVETTFIKPNKNGLINPDDVISAIKENTCLVSIMYVNNELGSINDIKTIARRCREMNIPFHSDCVQIFGKYRIDVKKLGIDALTMSFHKLYGPQGIGLLLISDELVTGYDLKSQINGTQQFGMRGGTENIPNIAGAMASLVDTFKDRTKKNKHLSTLFNCFIREIEKRMKVYRDYEKSLPKILENDEKYKANKQISERKISERQKKRELKENRYILILGPYSNSQRLPSTILISAITHDIKMCNIRLKQMLEEKKIIVGIGSACNSNSDKASHVIESIESPPIIRRGILRISTSDNTSLDDIKNLVSILSELIINYE